MNCDKLCSSSEMCLEGALLPEWESRSSLGFPRVTAQGVVIASDNTAEAHFLYFRGHCVLAFLLKNCLLLSLKTV